MSLTAAVLALSLLPLASPSAASPSTASPSAASPSTASPSAASPSAASPSAASPSAASPSAVQISASPVPAAVLSAAATVGRPIVQPAAPPAEPDDPDHTDTRDLEGGAAPIHHRAATYFSEDLYDAQLAHLLRVACWGSANVVGGAALMGGSTAATEVGIATSPELFGFGAQASLWGAINVAIAAGGYFFLDGVTNDLAEALDNEDTWLTVLLVNEVLDVGYVIVGVGMVLLGLLPIPLAAQLRGHGMGIVMQGAGLLLLDGLALLEAYDRKDKLDRFREVPAHQHALTPGE